MALRGSYVINLWSSACAPCRDEIPWFTRLERTGADVIGISRDNRPQNALDLIRNLAVTYPNYADPTSDFAVGLADVLPVNAVPTTIIATDGRVRWVHIGPFNSYADLRAAIEQRLRTDLVR